MAAEALTTLGKRGEFEFTEKKSVFIGYAAPIRSEAEALAFVAEIKAKHSDARHNVSAYTAGSVCHASDDGEPQGTGGVPVLDVIRKSGVDNAAVVVTRYFGGILLGAGGLVRAYSKAAAGAVADAGIVTYNLFSECEFVCSYSDYDRLLYELGKYTAMIDKTEFLSGITVKFAILACEEALFSGRIREMTGGKCIVLHTGERFDAKNNA